MIDANLSFNVATASSLSVLLDTVSGRNVNVPTRYKIMATLNSEYEKMQTSLKEILASQKHICVTADVWTSHAQSYLGATVHFIDKSFKRQSYLLGFKQMKQRQTNDVLAKALDTIFEEFGISHNQITNVVTDGGSAFCKMFKKYGDKVDAINVNDEIDNDSDMESDGESEVDESSINDDRADVEHDACMLTMVDEHGNEFVSEIISFDSEADGPIIATANLNDDEEYSYFEGQSIERAPVVNQIKMPPQRRCISHILNLIGKNFDNQLNGFAKTAYRNTFNSLHSLWAIIRNSSYAKTICKEILGVILKFPTETRWNSRFDCIKQCNR